VIHRNVFHNEELLGIEKVRWSPGQAGLICGWGLFTTVRITQGRGVCLRAALAAAGKGCGADAAAADVFRRKVRVHLQEVIRANKVTEGCARIYLIWNTVGGWKSDENMPDVDLLITTADLPQHPESVRLTVREQGRHAASPLAGVKRFRG